MLFNYNIRKRTKYQKKCYPENIKKIYKSIKEMKNFQKTIID